MASRMVIHRQPERQPEQSGRDGEEECPLPAPSERDPRHKQRRKDRADVGSGVEYPGRQRAFAFGEPLGHGFDRGGKIAGLAEAQGKSCNRKAGDSFHQGMGHRRKTPDQQGEGIAQFGADAIDHRATEQEADRVGELKIKAMSPYASVHSVPLQLRCKDADDLPIDVIHRRREENQGTDPVVVAAGRRGTA